MNGLIGVIGGDLRQRYLAQFLIEAGFGPVYGAALCPAGESNQWQIPETEPEKLLEQASIIAAPIPMVRGQECITGTTLHWAEVAGALNTDQQIFGGVFPEEMARYLRRKGIRYWDYMLSEEVALKNAVATAEGAIGEALRLWPENLQNCNCLVLGYGKCGRLLALRLKQFGAQVTVYARRKEIRVLAQTEGMATVDDKTLASGLSCCPVIFNTIPAPVLLQEHLAALPKEHLLIELAGGQGCVPGNLAEASDIHSVKCPGLPGKYAPKESARILAEYIIDMAGNLEQHA